MNLLDFIGPYGLWAAPLLFAGSVTILAFCMLRLIRLDGQSWLASLPLQEQQFIQFNEAGRVVLWAEGPRLSRRFARLDFELVTSQGLPIAGRTVLLRATRSNWSTVRLAMRSFLIPEPGPYNLHIRGLGGSQEGDSQHQIVFMKPHLRQAIGYILGTLAASGLMIGSLVLFMLRFLPMGGNP